MSRTRINEYMRSLDNALRAWMGEDEKPMEAHVKRFRIDMPDDPLTRHVAVMKMSTARPSLPDDMRAKAKTWLIINGFRPWDDGDVAAHRDEVGPSEN